MTASIRIMIVDDHTVARDGLTALLSRQGDFEIVGEARDGPSSVTLAKELAPDVVLMDMRMPGGDGPAAIRALASLDDPPHALVVTTYATAEDLRSAFAAGASGYLLKDASRETFWQAVREVHQGGDFVDPRLVSKLAEALRVPRLTDRQLEVLRHLSAGLSNKRIAKLLSLSEATVKTHVLAILSRLGASTRTEAVVIAVQQGLVRPRE